VSNHNFNARNLAGVEGNTCNRNWRQERETRASKSHFVLVLPVTGGVAGKASKTKRKQTQMLSTLNLKNALTSDVTCWRLNAA